MKTALRIVLWVAVVFAALGARAALPMSVTCALVSASSAGASASVSMKPSDCAKVVIEPEPLGEGHATAPPSPSTNATSTTSLRPNSEAMRPGTRAKSRCTYANSVRSYRVAV